jgi:hypothetical protein
MGTTPNYGLPYPEYADDPDGPAQIQALATAVDTELLGKTDTGHTHAQADITSLVADLAGKSPTSHSHSFLPNRAVRLGSAAVSFDSNGVATITHTLGQVPIGGVFSAAIVAGTGSTSFTSIRWYSGQATTTTFKIRAFDDTGAPYTSTATVFYAIF